MYGVGGRLLNGAKPFIRMQMYASVSCLFIEENTEERLPKPLPQLLFGRLLMTGS